MASGRKINRQRKKWTVRKRKRIQKKKLNPAQD